jgi:LacI family transcriptional regulator
MKKKVSIKDIASQLGVSTAAVSYALSGQEKEKRIGAELANKIRQTALELNYQPNYVARSLRQGTSFTIGLIVADITNTFFGELAKVIEDEASKLGFSVIVGSSDEDPVKSARLIETMQFRQVDGIIIAAAEESESQIDKLIKANLPTVLLDRRFKQLNVSCVMLDNHDATYQACELLLNKGYKNIAIIGYKSRMEHIQERYRGYSDALRNRNANQENLIYEIRYTHIKSDINKTLKKLLSSNEKVDSVIFATNSITIEALYYFTENNIRIPDDLAIIGFDGNAVFDLFYSPLTYVMQPIDEMGRQSVRLLREQITGKGNISAQVTLKGSLITRQSC